jgi:hypothetical protein
VWPQTRPHRKEMFVKCFVEDDDDDDILGLGGLRRGGKKPRK